VIVLMGSGETSPTMVELHKSLLAKAAGKGAVTVLDTPYGFQENADELSERAVAYFRESVGARAEVVSLRTADLPPHEVGEALAALGRAEYVFSGPGSPTYALAQWRAVGMGDVFADVVRRGGVVVLASAASVCAGVRSVPVYEIYKVGQAPYWEDGIDLLSRFGLRAGVVPHFNNAEGGTHDTSCCWIGRRRLRVLRELAPDLPLIGIDEHTALVLDPETLQGTVHGMGAVYVLVGDEETTFVSGSSFDVAAATRGGVMTTTTQPPAVSGDLGAAVAAQDGRAVVAALAGLVDASPQLAAVIAELEPVLGRGWAELPVDLLVEARRVAREDKQWALSDLLRDGLAGLGVQVEDTPEGQRVTRSG
jgi:cyanophycinase-like exopeptidase